MPAPSRFSHPRLAREARTIQFMVNLYCQNHHHCAAGSLCADCQELNDYALQRLEKCPFQENKSTCAHCTVHCYQRSMRERVRVVMRWAGPRMLLHHPVLAVLHLMDGFRSAPKLAPRNPRIEPE